MCYRKQLQAHKYWTYWCLKVWHTHIIHITGIFGIEKNHALLLIESTGLHFGTSLYLLFRLSTIYLTNLQHTFCFNSEGYMYCSYLPKLCIEVINPSIKEGGVPWGQNGTMPQNILWIFMSRQLSKTRLSQCKIWTHVSSSTPEATVQCPSLNTPSSAKT